MIKLSIKNIVNNDYELVNNDNIYKLNIRFFDIKKFPKIGDTIYMSENLIDKKYPEYSNCYQFGAVNSIYGREINMNSENEVICIVMDGENTYLKRIFG